MGDWWPSAETSATQRYIKAQWEFDSSSMRSGRPYEGRRWSDAFRSISGASSWKLRRDHILNDLSADLIAATEIQGLPQKVSHQGIGPGGVHAGGISIWLPLLDGGVFVSYVEFESWSTNLLRASQKTIVSGGNALAYLIRHLGFEKPLRRLAGEDRALDLDKLLSLQRDTASEEHARLIQSLDDQYAGHVKLVERLSGLDCR